MDFWKKISPWWYAFLITLCQQYMLSTGLITTDINLDHLAKVVLANFLHCKGTIKDWAGGGAVVAKPHLLEEVFL